MGWVQSIAVGIGTMSALRVLMPNVISNAKRDIDKRVQHFMIAGLCAFIVAILS